VKHVAVSNYYPEQVRALQTYLEDISIVSNQIEISLLRLAPFYEGWLTHDQTTENGYIGDGVLDQCMAMEITPLAWSPLAKSLLSGAKPTATDPRKERIEGVVATLTAIGEKHSATTTQVALAWLLKHPSGIVPLVGSNNPLHIHEAAASVDTELSWDEWYALYVAAWGRKMP
jgi:predicted oxidoreductase